MNGPRLYLGIDPEPWCYVYILVDPRQPERVRYVGWARNPEARLKRHIYEAHGRSVTHKSNWIRALEADGVRPALIVVRPAHSRQEAASIEIEAIAHYRREGHDLTNGTNGGDGVVGWSDELRARMSAIKTGSVGGKRSDETRRRISQAMKAIGHKPPAVAIERARHTNTGRKESPHVIERRAAQLRGRKMSPDRAEKARAIVQSEAVRLKLSEAAKRQWRDGRGWRNSEAAGRQASEARRKAWRDGVYSERLKNRNSDGTWSEMPR